MTHVTINTDGACLGNPGPGGFAAIIEWDPDGLITVSGGDPSATNNRMELSAVIEALRVLQTVPPLNDATITVRSDSAPRTNQRHHPGLRTHPRQPGPATNATRPAAVLERPPPRRQLRRPMPAGNGRKERPAGPPTTPYHGCRQTPFLPRTTERNGGYDSPGTGCPHRFLREAQRGKMPNPNFSDSHPLLFTHHH